MRKSLTALILAFVMLFSVGGAVGCKNGLEDSEDTLIIEVFQGGYGTSFMTRLGERFEELNPGKTVVVIPNPALTNVTVESQLKAGPKYTYTDMYFGTILNFMQWVSNGSSMLAGYDVILEDLSDVLDSPAHGDTVNIREKMYPEFSEFFTYVEDGNQYALPWASGANGIVYHADVFRENGWGVPKTTNELIDLMEDMKAAGWVPTTWPGGIGYWMYCTYPWWAQYEGMDNFMKFYYAKDDEGNYSDIQFQQAGRLESMKILEAIVGEPTNSYTGSNAFNHIESQLKFFDKEENKIAMIPNGDWLENEMKSQDIPVDVEIAMMRTPIISSIVNKLEKVKTESDLRKVIDYIDGEPGASLPAGVTENDPDVARIREARSITYSPGFTHQVVVPVYSNAKDLAKDFLRLLYSEEGQQIYFEETGSFLPMNGDVQTDPENVAGMTAFQKSLSTILADMKGITWIYYYDPLFYRAGMIAYNKTFYAESKLGAIGEDKLTAVEYCREEYNYIHERFGDYKISAGILS